MVEVLSGEGTILQELRLRKLAPLSQPLSKEEQTIDTKTAQRSESSEQANATIYAQVVEHRCREQDRSRCQCGTSEVVGSEQRSSVDRVCEGQVTEHALCDDEDADHANRNAEDAGEPVNVWSSGPR